MIGHLISAIATIIRTSWSDLVTAVANVGHNPLLALAIIVPAVAVGTLLYVIKRAERANRR